MAWLLFLRHRAHTGLVLVETCQSSGKTWTLTTKIAGNNARRDEMNVITSLYNLSTGDTVIITRLSRTFTKLTMAQMVAQEKAIMQEDNAQPAAPPEIVDTGRKEKIHGYDAEIYTAETPSTKFTCWITKDYPAYSAINAQLKKYRAMEKSGAIFPDLSNIDGLLVKYEIALSSGKTITATLVSARIQPIRDSDFRIPADYTLLPAPPLPAASPQPATPSQ